MIVPGKTYWAAAMTACGCLFIGHAAAQPPADRQLDREAFRQAFQQGFEQAFEQQMADIRARERVNDLIRAYRISTLEAISADEFQQRWQVDLNVDQRPAGDVLDELIQPLQWRIDGTDVPEAMLKEPITIKLDRCARLEAIERVCRDIGVTARYPRAVDQMWSGIARSPLLAGLASGLLAASNQPASLPNDDAEAAPDDDRPTISLHVGARELPITFSGPFAIEISKLIEWNPHATGSIELSAYAHDFPDSVMAVRQSDLDAGRITEIVNARGEDLRWDRSMSWVGQYPSVTIETQLCRLLRDVRTITVRGHSKIKIPVQVTQTRLIGLHEGATQSVNEGSVEITAINKEFEKNTRIALSFQDLSSDGPLVCAFDADGKLLTVDERSRGWIRRSGSMVIIVHGTPKELMVKVPKTESLEFPFEFRNIPLAKFEHQPRELSAIRYDGHQEPVSVTVDQIRDEGVFRKVVVSASNHTNKVVQTIQFELQYRNSEGEVRKTHTNSHGQRNPDHPVLTKGSRATFELTAFFMPDDATNVTLEIVEVVFSDATSWKKETDE